MPTFFARLKALLPRIYKPVANGILYALLTAFDRVLGDYDQAFSDAVKQLNILTSSGVILALWGYLLGVPRFGTVETDQNYARRIARTVMLPRTTKTAILTALQGITPSATITEYGTGTTTNLDYVANAGSLYSYFQNAFLFRLDYQGDSAAANGFFIGQTYAGKTDQGFVAPVVASLGATDTVVRDITEEMKMAGVRVIYQKQ